MWTLRRPCAACGKLHNTCGHMVPSVLWRYWLGGRKGIRPVKNWVVGCWRGYLSGARCRLASAQLMPLPLTVSCFSKIQIGFTFLVLAHLGSPGKRAVKRVCVCCVDAHSAINCTVVGQVSTKLIIGLPPMLNLNRCITGRPNQSSSSVYSTFPVCVN